jgi:hypothetical protein
VKARILCVLLLSACTDSDVGYDYALTWVCLSPEGCERAEEVKLVDRLNINGDRFYFASTRDQSFSEGAQRVSEGALPDGCFWMYSFSLFGHELEPSQFCRTSAGFELELSIPNRNPATHSQWLVEVRELGLP